MSNDNPFSSPRQDESTGWEKPAAGPGKAKPPGLFLAIAILAICFGGLGLSNGCCGVIGLASQGAMSQMMTWVISQSEDGDAQKVQEMVQAMMTASQKYLPLTILALVVSLASSVLMLTGGIMGVTGKAASKGLLIGGFAVGILYRIIEPVVQYLTTQAVAEVQRQFMEQMPNAPAFENDLQSMFTLIISGGTSVVLIALYLATTLYLLMSRQLEPFFAAKAAEKAGSSY